MVWSICAKVLMGEISSALFLLQEVRQLSDAPFLPLSFLFFFPLERKRKERTKEKEKDIPLLSIFYLIPSYPSYRL